MAAHGEVEGVVGKVEREHVSVRKAQTIREVWIVAARTIQMRVDDVDGVHRRGRKELREPR